MFALSLHPLLFNPGCRKPQESRLAKKANEAVPKSAVHSN